MYIQFSLHIFEICFFKSTRYICVFFLNRRREVQKKFGFLFTEEKYIHYINNLLVHFLEKEHGGLSAIRTSFLKTPNWVLGEFPQVTFWISRYSKSPNIVIFQLEQKLLL